MAHFALTGFSKDREQTLARARSMAERAARLNPNDEYAHWVLGVTMGVQREHDRAIAEFERALEINPNCSLAYGSFATVLNFAGYPKRSVQNNEIALRSNPRDPTIFYRFTGLAISHFLLGDYDSAIGWGRKAVQMRPDWYQGQVALIASLVEAGRLDEARAALAEYRAHCPGASLAQVRCLPCRDPAHLARFVDALRAAGCPE